MSNVSMIDGHIDPDRKKMTFEDVKRIRENPKYEDVDNSELHRLIDIAIEKRIPKKAKVEQFNRYNIYYCPTCDGCIGDSLGHIGDGFCSSCGQALDWSDRE
jgi:hypothetical protein